VHAVLDRHGLEYRLEWSLSGMPFLTGRERLVQATVEAIRRETGTQTQLSTAGGTSDGRFIAAICPQIVELGPVNATIHKIDEHVAVADLDVLARVYQGVLASLLADG
jgi:succinyl-diaminopimelate desuccinylase